jgi:hypothetical protein
MGAHFRIGLQRTREILKEGREMVKTGLAGRRGPHIRAATRARRKSEKLPPPSPPFRNYYG